MSEPAVVADAVETVGLDDWRAIGRCQVSLELPAGYPLRGDEAFAEICDEMDKLNGLNGERVAWDRVVRLGRDILSRKSKSLKVLNFVCLGLFEQNRYQGLLCGLCCLEDVVESHWDGLYPEAAKATERTRAISWLVDRLSIRIGQAPPNIKEQSDLLEPCLEAVRRLESILGAKGLKDPPSFGTLRRALQKPAPKPISPAPSNKKIDSPPTTSKSDSANASLISSEVTFAVAAGALRRAVAKHRETEPKASWPYRATRAMAWSDIDSYPANADGITSIPPPPDHIREVYPRLCEKTTWADLLSRSEADVAGFPLWLDLQYYCQTALSYLGPEYSAVRETVVAETKNFLRRLPELVDLKFSDGMPFANQATREWIQSVSLSESEFAVKTETYSIGDDLNKLRELWAHHKREGQTKQALGAWQEQINRATSHRVQFLIRFELAKLCLASGYPRIAKAQLEALDRAIRRFSLEDWEPELVRDTLLVWLRSFPTKQGARPVDDESAHEMSVLFNRLCQLDPVAAAALDKTRAR